MARGKDESRGWSPNTKPLKSSVFDTLDCDSMMILWGVVKQILSFGQTKPNEACTALDKLTAKTTNTTSTTRKILVRCCCTHLDVEEVGNFRVAQVGGEGLHSELDNRRRAHEYNPAKKQTRKNDPD